MGSRRGPSAGNFLGSSKAAGTAQARIQRTVGGAVASSVANVAFQATFQTAAVGHPAIAGAFLAFKAVKFMYPIVKKGEETYRKTHSTEKACETVVKETAKQAGVTIRGNAVDAAVGVSIDAAKKATNIHTDPATDTFVKSTISETISNVIEK